MEKNKKYYKKNYYNNNKNKYYKKDKVIEKKVTYDDLMHAEINSIKKEEPDYNKSLIIKCIALTIVIFAIIIASLFLFRKI